MTKRELAKAEQLADRLELGGPGTDNRHRIEVSMTVGELKLIIQALREAQFGP